ncbi:MAG: replicative DNA helicase [Desulfobacterota bacterium]|nr:replicative DNA helicase [Thermodesulfobacteriota bacterium]MDW8001629.1 replicative DNA helicase [Deltaproteobacteria bacterium]
MELARAKKFKRTRLEAKVPPQNLEAEQSVLGGILSDPEAINKVVDLISPEDFYREAHRKIYELMVELYEKNEPIDIITLSSLAKDKDLLDEIGGVTYLSSLVDIMPTAANIMQYAKIVREKAILREMINVANEIIERSYDVDLDVEDYVDYAERMIFRISEKKFRPSFYPIKDIVKENVKTIWKLYEKKQAVTGIPTGFIELDRLTSGLQPCDFIVVAGRPSMGKTAFCMNIAQYVSQLKDPQIAVGIFSMEMSKEQLVTRMLSSEAEVDHARLRTGTFSGSELQRIFQAAGRLSEAKIFIDDSPSMTILELRARARRLSKEHNVGLIIIDYLQLIKGRGNAETREQEISEISRFLKALAKELKIPIIAISQLNRMVEQREDKRPRLADLRESGAIEQDADLILFIYRDEVYHKDKESNKGIAEIIIGKQRNGPTDTIKLAFIDKYATFKNLFRE